MIVYKLHITWLKPHNDMQLRIIGKRIELVKCIDVLCAKTHGLGESLSRIDVLALIDRRHQAFVPIKHWDFKKWFHALRRFTASIGGNGVKEQSRKMRR